MSEDKPQRYWTTYVGADHTWRFNPVAGRPIPPPGEELAALRSGLVHEAGTAPSMWPFYTTEPDDRLARRGEVSTEQKAEHAALALFALHQQSQSTPMHRRGTSPGQALRNLRASGKFSEQAVDRRVNAAATATHPRALLIHLRGLVTQLRTVREPLDYDQLLTDLQDFHSADGRARVRRRWGLAYYGWKRTESDADGAQPPVAASPQP